MKPVEARKTSNENTVYLNLYPETNETESRKTPKTEGQRTESKTGGQGTECKFKLDSLEGMFDKGYTPSWTEEVFTISGIQYRDPITNTITDLNNQPINRWKLLRTPEDRPRDIQNRKDHQTRPKKGYLLNGKGNHTTLIPGFRCQTYNSSIEYFPSHQK